MMTRIAFAVALGAIVAVGQAAMKFLWSTDLDPLTGGLTFGAGIFAGWGLGQVEGYREGLIKARSVVRGER